MRQRRSNDVERSRQVDRHVAIPIIGRKLGGLVPAAHGAGRLHQNIEPPELRRGTVDGRADTVGIGEIGLERERDPTKRANVSRRGSGFDIPAVIDESHVSASARKLQAHGASDPAAAAGHQSLLVRELAPGLTVDHRSVTPFRQNAIVIVAAVTASGTWP